MRVWSRGSLRAVAQWDQLLFRGPVHSTLYFRGSSLSAFIRGLLAHWTSSLPAVSLSHCVTSGRWLCSSVRSEAAIPAREGCLNDTVTPHSPTFTDYWLPPTLFSISASPNVTVADSWKSKHRYSGLLSHASQAAVRE